MKKEAAFACCPDCKNTELLQLINSEYERASSMYKPFNSGHEGFAILNEEVDELWDAVKLNKNKHPERPEKMKEEAVHVAAMAMRFLHDICKVSS